MEPLQQGVVEGGGGWWRTQEPGGRPTKLRAGDRHVGRLEAELPRLLHSEPVSQ